MGTSIHMLYAFNAHPPTPAYGHAMPSCVMTPCPTRIRSAAVFMTTLAFTHNHQGISVPIFTGGPPLAVE